ncbi:MAG: DNA gyrase subunit A, partial [Candidatus Nealsonbacteria bacterium]|nr:DNA gyrase subunit A [Candidatus Nealsonbacteria bacterium]
GIRGIRLKKPTVHTQGDEVIGMEVIDEKSMQNQLLVVSELGFGKKTDLKEYRLQGRGGSGIKTAKVNSKTGNLVGSQILTGQEEDLIVISQKGQVIRIKVSSISKLSRATQGVRIMRLDSGDRVASTACV